MTKSEQCKFIGAKVRACAIAKGWGQRKLARESTVSITSIHELWHDDSPQVSVFTLDLVATALETTIDGLLGKAGADE